MPVSLSGTGTTGAEPDEHGHQYGREQPEQCRKITEQSATLKGDVTSENGWLITKNDKGWKNITYGGGFTMTDSQWIRAVGGKGIITTGEIKGGKVSSGGQSGPTVAFPQVSIYSWIKQP